jgi:hypothetical protein
MFSVSTNVRKCTLLQLVQFKATKRKVDGYRLCDQNVFENRHLSRKCFVTLRNLFLNYWRFGKIDIKIQGFLKCGLFFFRMAKYRPLYVCSHTGDLFGARVLGKCYPWPRPANVLKPKACRAMQSTLWICCRVVILDSISLFSWKNNFLVGFDLIF